MSPIDRELERALARRAAGVEPPAGLLTNVTKEASAMRRRQQAAVAGAALTVLAVAIAVPLLMRDDKPGSLRPAGDPTPTVSAIVTAEPSETATSAPTTAPPAVIAAVPVYYVGTKEFRPVLYREFHRVDVSGGKALAAAREAVSVRATDADYAQLFPAGSLVNAVSVSDGVATVDLNQRATEGAAGAETEQRVLDAVVWSVTAADTTVKTVKFTVDGRVQSDFWGHVDLSGTFRREAQENVLAPVWLLAPEPGSRVGRSFTIGGQATVFEATVNWEIYANGGKVAEGFATADNGAPARGDWSSTVTIPASVPAGTVLEIRAFEASAEDGRPRWTDTKSVTLA